MNDLVVIHEGKPMVSSELVAKKFGKAHRDVMRAINNMECSREFKVRNFAQSTFTNERGREYECYMMTRDGFSFLCMGFTGKEAAKWKEAYINAFNSMEQELLSKKDNLEWKQARLQGVEARKSVTDAIKLFVDYATNQGSKSANMYYANITKMEYKALELIAKNERVEKGFRDSLDSIDLCFLASAEQIAKASLTQGMNKQMHYKDIYQLAKSKVCAYASTVTFARIESEE